MALVPRAPVVGQLVTKTGRSARIESSTQKSKTTYKIVAKPARGVCPKVSLWPLESMEDNDVYLAICFELKNQNYFAAVNTETSNIQAEPRKDHSELNSKFLFKWVYPQTYTWNNLCSVAEPSKYLSVSGNVITLSTSQETLFKFDKNGERRGKSRGMFSIF